MSLRAGAAPAVSRTIATPPDRPGRLRSIGWLAGNLVRDQVGPIVAARGTPPAAAVRRPRRATARLPRRPPHRTTRRDRMPSSRAGSTSGGREPARRWAITVGGGPTVQSLFCGDGDLAGLHRGDGTYHVDVQHQASPESLLLGVALEVGAVRSRARTTWAPRRSSGRAGMGVAGSSKARSASVSRRSSGRVKTDRRDEQLATGCGLGDDRSRSSRCRRCTRAPRATGGVRLSRAFDLVAQLGAPSVVDRRARIVPELDGRPEVAAAVSARLRRRAAVALGGRARPTRRRAEDAIVDGLRAGRLDALAAAFDRWHGRVRMLARRLLSDPASAEDVVQEVSRR